MNASALAEGCVERCPGCAHRRFDAQESERRKWHWLHDRLAPWVDVLQPVQAVRAEARWGYRDRVALSAQLGPGGWHFGLWRGDELIAIPRCPVHSPRVNAVLALLAEALPTDAVAFPLAFVVCSGAQVVLVLKRAQPPVGDWLDQTRVEALSAAGVEGMWLHLFPSAGRRLFQKNGWLRLFGVARSRDAAGLWYGPGAFQQLIPALHQESIRAAERFLAPRPGDGVIDLYCGIGATLSRWQRAGAATMGVELGGEAVACARANVPGGGVLRGSCEARLPQLERFADTFSGERLLYLNPPRTGIEPAVLEWVGDRFRPRRIAYLSCSAGTLHRDLNTLCAAGYRVEHLIPYDFFPHTYHVETLALLSWAG